MTKKFKKPMVIPGLARQWLRRYEEEGESPPQIAKADGYDVRTVRKQIDLAREEREIREARAMVLRNALEAHYGDLCSFAQRLAAEISWPPKHISPFLMGERMCQALREHLPRSPIWKGIQRWEQLADQYEVYVGEVEQSVIARVKARGMNFAQNLNEAGLARGVGESLVFHVVSLARGHQGLKDVATFSDKRETDTSLHQVSMGDFGLGLMSPEELAEFRPIYLKLLDNAPGWDKSNQLRQVVLGLQRQSEALHEELATIVFRKVVPGRCRYCPL